MPFTASPPDFAWARAMATTRSLVAHRESGPLTPLAYGLLVAGQARVQGPISGVRRADQSRRRSSAAWARSSATTQAWVDSRARLMAT